MPVENKFITGLVDTGIFFVRDASFFHYCRKDTALLEDLVYYPVSLPSNLKKIENLRLFRDGVEDTIGLGWGYNYGSSYGGYPKSHSSSSISLQVGPNSAGVRNPVTSTTRILYDAYMSIDKPVRSLLSFNYNDQQIVVDYTSANNYPNAFGLNDELTQNAEVDTSTGIDINSVSYLVQDDVLLIVVSRDDLSVISSDTYSLATDKVTFISDIEAASKDNMFIVVSDGDLYTDGVSDPDVAVVLQSLGASSTNLNSIDASKKYFLCSIPALSIAIERVSISDIVISDIRLQPNNVFLKSSIENIFAVEVQQQSAYEDDGVTLKDEAIHAYSSGSDTTQAFSIRTAHNSVTFNMADIEDAILLNSPFAVQTTSDDLLEFLRLTDVVWIEFAIKIIKIKTTAELPVSSNVSCGEVFEITDSDDANYGTFFVLNSASVLVNKTSIPRTRTVSVRFTIVEVPGNPDNIRNSNTIYLRPANNYDSTYLDSARVENELPQALFSFFDGIPPTSVIYTNFQSVLVSINDANVLSLTQGVPDKTTTVNYEFPVNGKQTLYLDGILTNSSPTVTLIGQGIDYVTDVPVFLWQTSKIYAMPDDFIENNSPIVITDLLASPLDIDESTNINFRIDNGQLKFGMANNLIANPSFLYSGYGWTTEGTVTFPYDADKTTSVLHNRSCKLATIGSLIRQHIAGIDPQKDYSLSFMGTAASGNVRVNIIQINNKGVPLDVPPVVVGTLPVNPSTSVGRGRYIEDSALFEVVGFSTFTSHTFLPTSFEKIVARLYRVLDFNKNGVIDVTVETGLTSLELDTTDLIIEIENASSGVNMYIDCVQLETSSNPTAFSSNYDLATVEFETLDKSYAPRFLLSSTLNRTNNGFLSILVGDDDLSTEFPSEELLVYDARALVRQRVNSHVWAKLEGKDKYSHVGRLDRARKPFLGEYFLFPADTTPKFLSFIPDPLEVSQSSIEEPNQSNAIYGLVEDKEANNLPGKHILFEYGFKPAEMSFANYEISADDGTFVLALPEIMYEQVNPLLDITVGGSLVEAYGGYLPSSNEHYMVFDAAGNYSEVKDHLGATRINEASSTLPVNQYVLKLNNDPGVPLGFVKWPIDRLYDLELMNNGSAVVSFISAINGSEVQLSTYASTDYKMKTYTTTNDGISSFINIDLTTLNPMEGSFSLVDTLNSLTIYKEHFSDILIGNQFYFDRANSRIVINNPNLTSVRLYYLEHMAYINPDNLREIYIHRQVFLSMIRQLAQEIAESPLSTQSSETFGTTFSIPALTPFSLPLKMRVSANCVIYARASTGNVMSSTKITYTHKKALI